MKIAIKILFICSLLFLISCNESNKSKITNQFYGIGEFKIGAKFDTLKSYKLFEKVSENEYEIDKLELTKEIGVVEDLKIKTNNGKIYYVSFSKGKFTKELEIDDYFKYLRETDFSKEQKMNNEIAEYLFYESYDNKIAFEKQTMIDKELAVVVGYYDADYNYNDININNKITKKEKTVNDSIEKSIYMENVESIK